jgi:DNA-binding CsgD family transcriptional regulator
MAKSDLLRVADVRDSYRLIGECRDLGADPALWCPRMFEGLCRLIGAPHATGGEGRWRRPQHPIEPVSAFDFGLEPCARERYLAYMRDHGPVADPICRALQHAPAPLATRTRRQLVADAEWYRSASWEVRRSNGVDHQITSVYQLGAGIVVICLQRAIGERDFSSREQRLLNFFHGELGRLIGRSLVSAVEPGPRQLPRRLRQTLACLLEGDSEKQVAARLGLSPNTVHQYVTALYRRVGVQSRAELLAHALKRAQWRLAWPEEPPAR